MIQSSLPLIYRDRNGYKTIREDFDAIPSSSHNEYLVLPEKLSLEKGLIDDVQ
jgi:hypothetical protein